MYARSPDKENVPLMIYCSLLHFKKASTFPPTHTQHTYVNMKKKMLRTLSAGRNLEVIGSVIFGSRSNLIHGRYFRSSDIEALVV